MTTTFQCIKISRSDEVIGAFQHLFDGGNHPLVYSNMTKIDNLITKVTTIYVSIDIIKLGDIGRKLK